MHQISTEYRDTTRTIYLQSSMSLRELADAAGRLRSWAAIMGVPVAGAPVAQLSGSSVRVHLPIGDEVMPHPDTGIRLSALPSATVNRTQEVAFADVPRMAGRLLPGYTLEFHSVDGNFTRGDVLAERGALMPASLAPAYEPEAEAVFNMAQIRRHQSAQGTEKRHGPFGRLVASLARTR